MVNPSHIFPLLTALAVTPALAHDGRDEFDRFANAVQCAGFWLGDFAALSAIARDHERFVDTQQSYETGMTFRAVALEAKAQSVDEVDYLISVWSGYFSRLASDGGGSAHFPPATDGTQIQWAGEQFVTHERFCQGFGLSLEDKWGFH